MPNLELRVATPDHYESWRKSSITGYAEEIAKAGHSSAEEAKIKAQESFAQLLPDGQQTKDHYIYSIYSKDLNTNIGLIWFHMKPGANRIAFIYDFEIKEEFRGKGFSKTSLQITEARMKELGALSSALHVFAHNKIAVHLYQATGYQVTNLNMKKSL